ncbi:hypothetical protein VWM68_10020, partial [Campylobacter coli]
MYDENEENTIIVEEIFTTSQIKQDEEPRNPPLEIKIDEAPKLFLCHLDSEVFKEDLDELLKHSFDNGIEKIIIPGADIKDLPYAAE